MKEFEDKSRDAMKSFYETTRQELLDIVGRPILAARLYQSVYRDHARDFAAVEAFPDPKGSLEGLSLDLPAVRESFDSADGTRRYVLQLCDGQLVESVLIPREDRVTFCISSQAGCGLACAFCLTGQMGFIRDLSAGEIVSQVVVMRRDGCKATSTGQFSIVFMGMGEPLNNYDNVLRAVRILHDDHGLRVPMTRITISTAGLLPGIERLARESMFPNLSISLTGATNEVRDSLMPINRKYPIEEVIRTVQRFPLSRQKRVMFEYVLIKGVTDSVEDAARLAASLRGLRAKVNVIPLNPSPDIPFSTPRPAEILRFQEVLLRNNITTFVRTNRGNDVSAACGQLRRNIDTIVPETPQPHV
jgi:23S rRNA (adenine2503-C2)-methyltransferase